jgi:hypothetical protein
MPEPSILDARLAEIDRRLRMIQSGLEPVPDAEVGLGLGGGPAPLEPAPLPPAPSLRTAPPPPPPPPVPPRVADPEIAMLAARLHELTAAQERLLAATQDLLVEHADVLSRVAPMVGVSAGPFTDTDALQDFKRAVAKLPQVRDVAVREYAGNERAVLDVHLRSPIS